MKKTDITLDELEKTRRCRRLGMKGRATEELMTITALNSEECVCITYEDMDSYEKGRARIANIKRRFNDFEYFTEKERLTIYVKKD